MKNDDNDGNAQKQSTDWGFVWRSLCRNWDWLTRWSLRALVGSHIDVLARLKDLEARLDDLSARSAHAPAASYSLDYPPLVVDFRAPTRAPHRHSDDASLLKQLAESMAENGRLKMALADERAESRQLGSRLEALQSQVSVLTAKMANVDQLRRDLYAVKTEAADAARSAIREEIDAAKADSGVVAVALRSARTATQSVARTLE